MASPKAATAFSVGQPAWPSANGQTTGLTVTTPATAGAGYHWQLVYTDAAGLVRTIAQGTLTVVRS